MSAPIVVKQFPLEEEYAKKTGVTPEDVSKLRAWLATQPHLPGDLLTDLDLILAYHCCGCSAEVAKQVLDLNLTLKTLFENFFKNRVVDQKIMATLNVAIAVPLPTRSHAGSAVLHCRIIDRDAKKFLFHECVRAVLMILELWQEEEGTWPGLSIIFDLKLFSLQHLARLSGDFQSLQQFIYYLQEAMLVKVTGLHFINAPSFVDKLMMLVKPLLKKSLLEVLTIHEEGTTTLEQYLPIDGLPAEAGGKYESMFKIKDDIQERMKLNKEFFATETKKRVTESKRPGKPKTISDIFGSVEGSFKKLEID